MNFKPSGKISLTWIFVPVLGPSLLTVTVNVTFCPTFAFHGDTSFLILKSAVPALMVTLASSSSSLSVPLF
jgi:hypothetical protein